MKKRILFTSALGLFAALMLNGCASDGMAKVIKELKNDPATVDVKLMSPWGVAVDFHRSFPTNWAPPAK